VARLYQKAPEIDLLSRVKNPAVATAAFWEPFPTVTPALAAAPQGVAGLTGPSGAFASSAAVAASAEGTSVVVPGSAPASIGVSAID
jgi:hypothetical protein